MLKFDQAELSHIVQDSSLSLETRMALVLINHGYDKHDIINLETIPLVDWIAFEKPLVKIFKKKHQENPFKNIDKELFLNDLNKFIK